MKNKKGLGRGLSALIPEADMEFLSQVARGESILTAAPTAPTAPAETAASSQAPAAPSAQTGSTAQAGPTAQAGGMAPAPATADAAPAAAAQPSGDGGAAAPQTVSGAPPVEWLPLTEIVANPFQPRRHFGADELADLVASIKEHGILQPILVRPRPAGSPDKAPYQLVAGERRWRAAQTAGLTSVPAVIRAVDDQQALELAIIENVQRHDISAIDTALAYKRLSTEFQLSQEAISARVGKSRSAVANTLRLLDLPIEVRRALEAGDLSEGHGRAILLAHGEGARKALFKRALRDKLSVRELERLAQESNKLGQEPARKDEAPVSGALLAERKDLQLKLQKRLGAKVDIAGSGRSGRISIHYSSLDEFDRLCELLTQH